jgi:hypothetical protein
VESEIDTESKHQLVLVVITWFAAKRQQLLVKIITPAGF